MTKRRTGTEQKRRLEAAGYRLREVGGGKRIWEGPDGALYTQEAAMKLLEAEEREEGRGEGTQFR